VQTAAAKPQRVASGALLNTKKKCKTIKQTDEIKLLSTILITLVISMITIIIVVVMIIMVSFNKLNLTAKFMCIILANIS
jgi:hypothetical protein